MNHIITIKKYILRFRTTNRDIFDAILNNKKRVETRAATKKYLKIKTEDRLIFVCGKDKIIKEIKKIQIFKTINSLVRKYRPVEINPRCKTKKQLEKMYSSFPGYTEKLKECGIIVFELK